MLLSTVNFVHWLFSVMIKLLFFIILTYTIASFDLCDLNNFSISRAAHFLLGRRENINIIRHYDFFISFFSDFICIVLLLILSSISLGYILCRFVSFASYDTNLGLSYQNHPLSTKPIVDTLNALLTFTTLSHFFLKNPYGLILIVTDLDIEVIPYIFGFLDLVSDLNVKIHHFLLFCLIVNFRLLIYTIHLYFIFLLTDHMTMISFHYAKRVLMIQWLSKKTVYQFTYLNR